MIHIEIPWLMGSLVLAHRHCYVPAHRVGALSVDGRCLSVGLPVPCLTLSQEWKAIVSE